MIGDQVQVAVYEVLIASALADGRVYDNAPAGGEFPYLTIGDEQVIDDGNSCTDAYEVVVDVHVWSRSASGSRREAKQIGAAVTAALAKELTIDGFHTVVGHLETARYLRDPDGVTNHGVLTFRYLIEPMET